MHIENRAKLKTSLLFEVGKCNVLPQQKAVQIKNLISGKNTWLAIEKESKNDFSKFCLMMRL